MARRTNAIAAALAALAMLTPGCMTSEFAQTVRSDSKSPAVLADIVFFPVVVAFEVPFLPLEGLFLVFDWMIGSPKWIYSPSGIHC